MDILSAVIDAQYLRLQLLGFDVFATLLPHEPREHLTSTGIYTFTADVTKDEDIALLEKTISSQTNGGLDVLVNCA